MAPVQESDLPFAWKKLQEDDEEDLCDVQLVQAWVVDLPDPKLIAPVLKWLKHSALDNNDALSHLKRVRRQDTLATLLLDTSTEPPVLPSDLALDRPRLISVPRYPARTPTSLALKNTLWPTVFCPKRKWEPEQWTEARVRWAMDAVGSLKAACIARHGSGELPVVAHVPLPFQDDGQELPRPIFGHDTRSATKHPLRHAVLDVIRQVADDRTTNTEPEAAKNGAQYLLTGLSLFVTHEPCLMCTMALLHSRVKEVFYLVPMPQTGGCGGIACVPALRGVNHRFNIGIWKEDPADWPRLLDPAIDM